MTSRVEAELAKDLDTAEAKAWDALSRYKFMMFGYWAAIWVHQNHVGHFKRPSPWKRLVLIAREVVKAARRPATSEPAPALFDEAA